MNAGLCLLAIPTVALINATALSLSSNARCTLVPLSYTFENPTCLLSNNEVMKHIYTSIWPLLTVQGCVTNTYAAIFPVNLCRPLHALDGCMHAVA